MLDLVALSPPPDTTIPINMTVASFKIDEVRQAVDAALEGLNDSLRKVNHEVSPWIIGEEK